MNFSTFSILCILITASTLFPQTDPKFDDYLARERANLPVDGEQLYNGASLSGYRFSASNGATKKVVDADSSLPFARAMQLDIKRAGENSWEPQLQTPKNTIPLEKGDVLFYIFYVRVIESAADNGMGQGNFYVQRAESPWTGLGSQALTIRSQWHKYYVVAEANEDYPIQSMEATLHLGYLKQTIEIGGIIALRLGKNIDVRDLPTTPIYYDGMEENAIWRQEAAARINQYRKGDLTVKVVNKEGMPIKNAVVRMEMKEHLYGFGTFMSELTLSNSTTAKKYKEEVFKLFNCATTPFYMGDGNWGWYGPGNSRTQYPALAQWLMDHNIPTKGHVLIWPAWNWMPPFFEKLKDDPAALRVAIEEHLDTVVPIGAERGLIQWDVVNEPHINHDVLDICGDDIMIDWYKQVHALHPEARLILNEYNIIMGGGRQDFQDDFDYYIQLLLDDGAPLGGLGLQCHFDSNLTGIPRVLEILDHFAHYNLPIQITEFDIDILDQGSQADYTRDFFTAVFSHPATDKIVMWGFWEGDQWKPNGAMIRTDWSYKPNYHVYMDLLYNQWWTDVDGSSNRQGLYSTRGFFGDYEISASFDGETAAEPIHFNADTTVQLQIQTSQTGLDDIEESPIEYGLKQNYPNPFNSSTVIEFIPDHSGEVELIVYDMAGKQVFSKKITVTKGATCHEEIVFDFLPSGSYYYSLVGSEGKPLTAKMMMVK